MSPNHSRIASMARLLGVLLAAMSLLASCGGGTTAAPRPSAQPAKTIEGAHRAILYIDVHGSGASRAWMTNSVTADGTSGPVVALKGFGATWSPDGSKFAYVDRSNDLVVGTPADHRTLLPSKKSTYVVSYPMWSPDGSKIAVLAFPPNRAIVVDATTGQRVGEWKVPQSVAALPYPTAPLYHMAWSPDGTKLLFAWESVGVLDTTSGVYTQIAPTQAMADWSPDGKGVFYLSILGADNPAKRGLGGLHYRALDSSTATQLTSASAIAAAGYGLNALNGGLMDLSPDGTQMALVLGSKAGDGSYLVTVPVESASSLDLTKPTARVPTSPDPAFSISWSPDGTQLAVETLTQNGVDIKSLTLASESWRTMDSMTVTDISELESMAWSKPINWAS